MSEDSPQPKLEIEHKIPSSNKDPAVKAAVIARHLAGESSRNIAKDLHISRPTIAVILAEADLGQYIADAKSNFLNTIPKAVENVIRAIDEGNLNASIVLLKGIGVLTEKLVIEESEPLSPGTSFFQVSDNREEVTH